MKKLRSSCLATGWATRLPGPLYHGTLQHLALLVVFVFVTLLMMWPMPARLTTHLMGEDFDVWNRPWNTWWTRQVLTEGGDFYFTDYVFYPQGSSLIYHSFSHTNTALSLLLEPFVGMVAGYNIPGLLAYVFSGFAMYLLVMELTGDWMAGLVAGLIYAFAPYHVDQSSHPIAYTTQWIPLTLLFLIRMLRRGRVWDGILAAVFLALTALSSWHLFLFTLLFITLFFGFRIIFARSEWKNNSWRSIIIFGGAALVLIVPFLYPLVREQFVATDPDYVRTSASEGNVADLLLFIVPSRRNPLWGEWFRPIHHEIGTGSRQIFLGFAALLLAVYGLVRRFRAAAFWALAAIVFFILALGPYPTVNGQRIGLLLPWGLPIASIVRDTQRFVIMVNLTVAVLAGLGVAALRERMAGRRRALISGALVIIVLVKFLTLPFPNLPVDIPDFYRQIANDPDPSAIVDVPIGKLTLERLYMFYQTVHEKPIVEGIVGRKSSDSYDYINGNPLLTALRSGDNRALTELGDLSRQLGSLREVGFRYIVLHRQEVAPEQVGLWQAYLGVSPLFSDEQIIVYATDPQPGRDYGVAQPLAGNLGIVQSGIAPLIGPAESERAVMVLWTATDRPEGAFEARFGLTDATGRVGRQWTEALWPRWPTNEWDKGALANGRYPLNTDGLPAGLYQLTVDIIDQLAGTTIDIVDLGGILVTSPQGSAPTRAAEASLGDSLKLLGYDLIQNESSLFLSPHWRLQETTDQDFKFFAHLVDVVTGELVAQYDAIPQVWGYPTSAWIRGQTVADLMIVSLDGVSPGEYYLAVGAYDSATGERLPATGPNAWTAREGNIKLPETIIIPEETPE